MKPVKREHELIRRIALGTGYAELAPASDRETQLDRESKPAYEWMAQSEKAVQIKCKIGKNINLVNPVSLRSPVIKRSQVPIDLSNLYSLHVYDKEIDFFDESQHRQALNFKANIEDAQRRKAVLGRKMLVSKLQSNSKDSVRSRKRTNRKIYERMVTHTKIDRMFEEYMDEGKFLHRSEEETRKILQDLEKCKQKDEWKPAVSIEEGKEETEAEIRQKKMIKKFSSFMTECSEVSQIFYPSKKELRANSSTGLEKKNNLCVKQIIKDTKTLLPKIHRQLKKDRSAEGSQTPKMGSEEDSPRPDLSSIFKTNDQLASFEVSAATPKQKLELQIPITPRPEKSNSGEHTQFLPSEVRASREGPRMKESSSPAGSISFGDSSPLPALDTDAIIVNDIRRHYFDNVLADNVDMNEGYSRPFMINMVTDKPRVYIRLPHFENREYTVNTKTNVVGGVMNKLADVDSHYEVEASRVKSILRSKDESSGIDGKVEQGHSSQRQNTRKRGRLSKVMKKVDFNKNLNRSSGMSILNDDSIVTLGLSQKSRPSRSLDPIDHNNMLPSVHEDSRTSRREPEKQKSIIAKNQSKLDLVKRNLENLAKMKIESRKLKEKQNGDLITSMKSYRRDQPYFKQAQLESLHTISLNSRYAALRATSRIRSEQRRIRQFTGPEGQASKQLYCRMTDIYKKYATSIRVINKPMFECILNYHRLIVFEGGHLGKADFDKLVDFTNRWPGIGQLNASELAVLGNFIRSYGGILNYADIRANESSILNSSTIK